MGKQMIRLRKVPHDLRSLIKMAQEQLKLKGNPFIKFTYVDEFKEPMPIQNKSDLIMAYKVAEESLNGHLKLKVTSEARNEYDKLSSQVNQSEHVVTMVTALVNLMGGGQP